MSVSLVLGSSLSERRHRAPRSHLAALRRRADGGCVPLSWLTKTRFLFVEQGYLGVSFFFLLSGFILAHVYGECGLDRPDLLRRYAVARLARIYPAYAFALVFSLPFVLWRIAKTGITGTDLLSFITAPLALQSWYWGSAAHINAAGWSISTEFFFYVCFPVLLSRALRRPLLWALIAVALAVTSTAVALALANGVPPSDPEDFGQFGVRLPPCRLGEFLGGIALYGWWRRRPDLVPSSILLPWMLLAAAVLAVAAHRFPSQALTEGAAAILWIPVILAGAQLTSGPLTWRSFTFLGNLSYGLYLLHIPVGAYASAADRHVLHLFGASHQWELSAASFSASLILSAALYYFFEQPMRRRILAFAGRRGSDRAAEALRAV